MSLPSPLSTGNGRWQRLRSRIRTNTKTKSRHPITCQERGLNTRPPELQSVALPAELSRLVTIGALSVIIMVQLLIASLNLDRTRPAFFHPTAHKQISLHAALNRGNGTTIPIQVSWGVYCLISGLLSLKSSSRSAFSRFLYDLRAMDRLLKSKGHTSGDALS